LAIGNAVARELRLCRVCFVAVNAVLQDSFVERGAVLVELRFQLLELVELLLLFRTDLGGRIRTGGLSRSTHYQTRGRNQNNRKE